MLCPCLRGPVCGLDAELLVKLPVGAGEHLAAELGDLLDGVDSDVTGAVNDDVLALEGVAAALEVLVHKVDQTVAGGLGTGERAAKGEALAREDNELMKKQALDVENENNTVLKRLFDLRDELQEVKTRDAFDDVLNRIRLEDGKLDQDAFTEEQKRVYDTLSRAHTSLITGKTAELEREENMDYNSRAVSFFADAFSKFKKDENRYTKNEDALKSLADTYLFAFDANRLLPATVAYYNYIYQYIFDKLSEDGKLFLTRLATEKDRTRW